MSERKNFRIIVIDDNPNIHADFIKILTFNKSDINLQLLKEKLFPSNTKVINSESSVDISIDLPIFEIDTASQGLEGIEKIRLALEEGRPFSLAFVDIRMPPGLDGVKTIKQIWAIDREIQVVICTAYTDYTWEETIEELGMGDNLLILKKPFDITAVRQLACTLTKKWALSQENREHADLLEKTVVERTNLLQESLSQIRATLESSADGIVVVSKDGIITDYNSKFVNMWGITDTTLKSKQFKVILDRMSQKLGISNKLSTDIESLENNPAQIRTATLTLNNGQIIEYYTQPHELKNTITGRVWSFRDITQQVYLQKKLEFQATHDSLTNLPNRLLLIDRLKHAISMSARNKTMCAVVFFDLDRFKVINDSLSHEAGDELLNKLSKRISDKVRASDTISRLGGDEFVLIAQGIIDEKLILEIVERLSALINEPFNIASHLVNITASIGISVYPKDGKTAEELLRNADLAMYLAKREGKNKFQFYEKELNDDSLLRFEKEIELRRAIINNEFVLHYQPQIDTNSNELIGVEALIRWQHPTQGLISPVEFIAIADDCGLMQQIGKWVLCTACTQNKKWQNLGHPKMLVAVNVTRNQLNDPSFFNIVTSALKDSGLAPEYLQIELTEDVVINNKQIENIITDLSKLGIKISFDDFGTGNSSLNYLRKFPVNQLKIDKSFIQNINTSNNDDIIIRAILSMASDLKLDVVAEGVETLNQLEFLHKYDCHEIQGYYFSQPLTVDGLEKYLQERPNAKHL